MREIVVTGGSGKAGRAVVSELAEHGYQVRNVDLAAGRDPNAPTLDADLTDLGQTIDALKGTDAVIHLAAIPAPNVLPDEATFRINTMSTYNVFSAAVTLGLKKVVWASSETLIGIPFDREQPRYAPIDEKHERLPEFHYALSKLLGEEMAQQFARWSGIPFVGLRYSNIMEVDDYQAFPSYWEDPGIRQWNLWGYVDARDVASATRLALAAPTQGSENFLVAAADTCMPTPSRDLMAAVFPTVPIRKQLGEHETLLSVEKASQLLSYRPIHSWRQHL